MIEPGDSTPKPPAPEVQIPGGWLFGLFAFGLLSQICDSDAVRSLYTLVTGVTGGRIPVWVTLASVLFGELFVLAVLLVLGDYSARRFHTTLSAIGMQRDDNWRDYARLGLRTFVRVYPFILALGFVVSGLGVKYHLPTGQEALLKLARSAAPGMVSVALFVLVTAVAAPITEELLFRGLLYGSLRRAAGVRPAIVGSAAIFALLHGATLADVPVFALGIVLAWLYERSGSLIPGIVLHATNNAIALTFVLIGLRMGSPVGFAAGLR